MPPQDLDQVELRTTGQQVQENKAVFHQPGLQDCGLYVRMSGGVVHVPRHVRCRRPNDKSRARRLQFGSQREQSAVRSERTAGLDQPPFLGRLPGFFLLRVAVPRSRLRFWPPPSFGCVKPAGGTGFGALISASTLIFLAREGSVQKGLVTGMAKPLNQGTGPESTAVQPGHMSLKLVDAIVPVGMGG